MQKPGKTKTTTDINEKGLEDNDQLNDEDNNESSEESIDKENNNSNNKGNNEANNPTCQKSTRKENNTVTTNKIAIKSVKTVQNNEATKNNEVPGNILVNLTPKVETKRQKFRKSNVFVYLKNFIANFFDFS